MIRPIGPAEGAGFPNRRPRDQEGRGSAKRPAVAPDTPPKRRRSSPGEELGKRLDIDV